MSSIPVLENMHIFMGARCYIYDNANTLRGRGIFTFAHSDGNFSCSQSFEQLAPAISPELQITIKNIEENIPSTETEFIIKAVENPENDVFLLLTGSAQWEHVGENNPKKLYGVINATNIEIANIDEQSYRNFEYENPTIDWSKINTNYAGGTGKEKEDAFEDLCCALLQQWKVDNLDRTGKGADSGKDAEFTLPEKRIQGLSFSSRWILQCKYSENYTNLNKEEIYKEMVKVLEHRPDHLLIMTNRKKSAAFDRWFKSPIFKPPDYIPFHVHIIGKDILDKELSKQSNKEIRDKFFPQL